MKHERLADSFETEISKRRAIGALRAERKLKGLPGLMSTGYAEATN